MNCGVAHRRGSDSELLWLWHRPVTTAPIRPLAWEPPNALGGALEKAERQKKNKIIIKFNIMILQIRKKNLLLKNPKI